MTKDKLDRATKKQDAKNWRFVNFRGLFVAALFLICAVFSALVFCNIPVLGIILIVIEVFLAVTLGISGRKRKVRLITFILSAVISVAAFSSFVITEKNWTKPLDYSKEMSIVGTVESDIELDGTRRIYLKNVSLNGERVNGRLLIYVKGNGAIQSASNEGGAEITGGVNAKAVVEHNRRNLSVKTANTADSGSGILADATESKTVKAGSVIKFSGTVTPKNLTDGFRVFGKRFRDGLHYQSQADVSDIMTIGYRDPGVFIKMRTFIHGKLTNGLGREYGELSYSFLTGDKAYLEIQVRNYFSAAGLAHVLAVSGMQLGFLSVLIVWLCKKLRAGRLATSICVSFLLLAYAFIAGFSPSVCRAAIMSMVGVAIYLFGKQRDSLSSLSLAFCVIVTATPFLMFEAGFILSFCAVFGIILFRKPIETTLLRLRLPQKNTPAKNIAIPKYSKQAHLNQSDGCGAYPRGYCWFDQSEDDTALSESNGLSYSAARSGHNEPNREKSRQSVVNPSENYTMNVFLKQSAKDSTGLFWKPQKLERSSKARKIKWKIRRKAASAFAFGAAVHIGIFPALIFIFNNFQLYGLVVNILVLPLVAITFTSAAVCLLISVIIPPLKFHFFLPKLGFRAIDFIAESVAKLPLARVVVYALPVIFVVYALYFACSNYVNLPKKWAVRLAALALCMTMLVVQNPAVVDNSSVVPMDIGASAVTYITDGKSGYLAGDIWSGHLVLSELKERRVRRLDAVFVDKMDYKTAVQIQVLSAIFSNFTAYYPAATSPAKDSAEGREVLKKLSGIKTVAFECENETGVTVVELIGTETSFGQKTLSLQNAAYQQDASYQQDTIYQQDVAYQQDTIYQQDAVCQQDTACLQDAVYQQDTIYQQNAIYQQDAAYQQDTVCQQDTANQQNTNARQGANSWQIMSSQQKAKASNPQKTESEGEGTRLEAIFVNGVFSAYSFKKLGLESNVSVLMPRTYFRYDWLDSIDDYNIIRAYHYRDVGNKLYLIGEDSDAQGVYSTKNRYCYNYKTYRFY